MLHPAELRRHMGIDRMLSTDRMNIADVFYRKMRFLSRKKYAGLPKQPCVIQITAIKSSLISLKLSSTKPKSFSL